jgi:hypothetical protein
MNIWKCRKGWMEGFGRREDGSMDGRERNIRREREDGGIKVEDVEGKRMQEREWRKRFREKPWIIVVYCTSC